MKQQQQHKQYLNFNRVSTNYSFKYSFDLIFNRIETVFFSFLCVLFLVVSRIDDDFSKDVSFAFTSVSMPVVKIASFPFNTLIDLLTNFNELVEAKKENKVLKEELSKLKSFYITALNTYRENQELRKILTFASPKSTNFKVARVIGKSHQLFNQKIFIDIGKNRDIKEGEAVTGTHGLMGRVLEVGDHRSRLMLLTDASSRIPVITSRSRTKAILAGNSSNLMEMLYLPKNHSVEVGDLVFTSGDGDALPLGLLVGVVKKIDKGYAAVEMVEDVNNADIVTIMVY